MERYHIETEACPECGEHRRQFYVDYLGIWKGDDGRRRVVVSCVWCEATWVEYFTTADEMGDLLEVKTETGGNAGNEVAKCDPLSTP